MKTQTEWLDPAVVASVAPLRVRLQDRLEVLRRQIVSGNAKYEAMPYKRVDPERDAIDEQVCAMEAEETALVAAVSILQANEIKGISAPIPEIPHWHLTLAKERLEQAKEAQEQAIAETKEAADSPFDVEPPKVPVPGVDCPFPIPVCKRGESIYWIQAHPNRFDLREKYPLEPVAAKLITFAEHPDRQFIIYRYMPTSYFKADWVVADLATARVIANYCPTRAKVIDKVHKLFTGHGEAKWRKIFREAEEKLKELPARPSLPKTK